MTIRNLLLAALLAALLTVGLFCVGGSSESGNARSVIVGSIVDDNETVHGAQVQLVAEGYVPGNDTIGRVFTAYTDEQGGYRFEEIPKGGYYLNSRFLEKRLLRGPICIVKSEEDLSIDSLSATAQVTMQIPDTSAINVVFLKGTVQSRIIASKTIVLDSIPSGAVTIVGFTQQGEVPQTLTPANSKQLTISVAPADTAKAAFNNAPPRIIISESALSRSISRADSAYHATIFADDPENDVIRFAFLSAPAGMSLDSLMGTIVWQLSGSSPPGSYRIGVEVADVKGSSRSIWWTITVVAGQLPDPDNTPPEIMLLGKNPDTVAIGQTWKEPGYRVLDNRDTVGLGAAVVVTGGPVVTTTVGFYRLFYDVKDTDGNPAATKIRIVIVMSIASFSDTTPPVITLNGKNPDSVDASQHYVDPGATAVDDVDGDISSRIVVGNIVSIPGSYTITYTATDMAGNSASVKRIVTIAEMPSDTAAPVITLLGENPDTVVAGTDYVEPGWTAYDDRDGNRGDKVIVSGIVNTSTAGDYSLTYTVTDAAGNTAISTRQVTVVASGQTY